MFVLVNSFLILMGLVIFQVETRKHIVYSMVYLFFKLALPLPVATIIKIFFAIILNVCLVTYIDSDVFDSVENEKDLTTLTKYEDKKSNYNSSILKFFFNFGNTIYIKFLFLRKWYNFINLQIFFLMILISSFYWL